MFCRSRKTAADIWRDEGGNVLATVMIVALLIGALSSLALATGRQSDTSSASDRNHDQSLGVAEAGVHEAIVQLGHRTTSGNMSSFSIATANAPGPPSTPTGTTCPGSPLTASPYPQGAYYTCVTQSADGYVIDSEGKVGGTHFGRKRHIRVQLTRPGIFPNDQTYALFSDTSITLKNGDRITGNVWANDYVDFSNGSYIDGSLTSARSWVDMNKPGPNVTGVSRDVWTGGYCDSAAVSPPDNCKLGPNWAINLGPNTIGGSAKASSSAPCTTGTNSNYDIAGNGTVVKDVTTWGTFGGSVGGIYQGGACTTAPAPYFPTFKFNPTDYGCTLDPPYCPPTYHEFSSVSSFQSWLSTHEDALQGTFWVQDPAPSELNRVDLSGVMLAGDTTIVTNAPVFSNDVKDDGVATSALFKVVSHYAPDPAKFPCSLYDHTDESECAIHFKNGLNPSCKTAVLLYADKGPVGIKNNATMCGLVIGAAIEEQNSWTLTYDDRLRNPPGFGPDTWEIGTWQELVPQ
jgi:hypothetical protein